MTLYTINYKKVQLLEHVGCPASIHQFLAAFCYLCNNMYPLESRKKFQLCEKDYYYNQYLFFDVHLFSPGANVILLCISHDLPLSKELAILNHQTAN